MQTRQMVRLAGIVTTAVVLAALPAYGQQKCGGATIANGPFQYAVGTNEPTSYSFVGSGGEITTAFTVTAPRGGTVFPAESPGAECSNEAPANIRVFSVEKVVNGSPVNVSDALASKIAAAFNLSPSSYTFTIGDSVHVNVTITNPDVSDQDYGSYLVKMKAQATGSGVGVGSGFQFALNLRPSGSVCVDNVVPVVNILRPTSADKILGNIVVKVEAYDPTLPESCASGLASLTATVSSAQDTVHELNIPLTLNAGLPASAGTHVAANGLFTPTGGAGTAGTTPATAFLPGSRSGIGSYTITFTARDVADNVATASVTFEVKYAVNFTHVHVPGCDASHINSNSCRGQYQFTATRATDQYTGDPDNYSDGAFMYDQTVEADLVRTSDSGIAATHLYGGGDIKKYVQINGSPVVYQTDFAHIGGDFLTEYVLKIYFQDVDNISRLQATSAGLTF